MSGNFKGRGVTETSVLGYRLWFVNASDLNDLGRFRLYGLWIGNLFPIRWFWSERYNQAVCQQSTTDFTRNCYPKDVPNSECECGFYAYYPFREVLSLSTVFMPSVKIVFGLIRGYGSTILGTRGFRTQKADILALTPRNSTVDIPALQRSYPHIPVLPSIDQMCAEFPASEPPTDLNKGEIPTDATTQDRLG